MLICSVLHKWLLVKICIFIFKKLIMIRILHLTDFHLNKKSLKDWNDYIRVSLLNKIKEINNESEITFVAFTGDLLDQGGVDFSDAEEAFKLFQSNIITPITEELNIPIENFLIVPGNHDVVRDNDSEREELGNLQYFQDPENVSKYMKEAIEKDDFSGMKRMLDYKKFEKKLYENVKTPKNITIFGSSFILKKHNANIGIACLNSSWRCYDKKDKGRLIIGENQLIEQTKFIENVDLKIGLIHHPLDTLSQVEDKLISNHIYNEFDLLLLGDYHESKSSMITGITGSLFVNLAPSGLSDIRSDSKRYSNGFTVVDLDIHLKEICVSYFKYNHDNKTFLIDPNSSGTDDGKFCQNIPSKEKRKDIKITKTILQHIIDNHYLIMNNHMIGVKADIDITSIKDAFILPPITKGKSLPDEDDISEININQIVKSSQSQMFFGNKESGKTVLLYRLVREYVDEFQHTRKIPVYCNFDEIGNKEFTTVIREYLSCKIEDVKELLSANKIVLLIDNLDYKELQKNEDKLKQLHRFILEYENLQIIATGEGDILGSVPPIEYIEYCKIPFKKYFIQNLTVKEIKSIMKMWTPNEDSLKIDFRIDKMVSDFNSYSLPSTAMSVSLFLWSTENSDRKPINNAVLLEIYIETILEKLNQENIYRSSFDFKNKLQLLSKIAQEMLLKSEDDYSLKFSEFIAVIENYLIELVGFDYDSKVISEYFIERKIFIKYQGNRIKFAYSCFFNFFIAKRMEFNEEFKEFVLGEDEYFKYIEEIDYYTGLTRSDKKLLSTIFDRFKEEFGKTDYIFEQLKGKWDTFFIIKNKEEQNNKFESVAKRAEITKIKDNRPSQKMLDEFQNKRLSSIQEPGKILRKQGEVSLEKLLVIMSNVLRNSEGVEDIKLKKDVYDTLVKYLMVWMVIYREFLLEYILKNEKLPPSFPNNVSIQRILMDIPFHVQNGMYKHMGSPKLAPIILSKLKKDFKATNSSKSDLETFLSVALYADIEGNNFPKYFKNFIKKLKNNPVRDYSYFKLITYYYRRTKVGSPNEELYLNMLAELRIKSQKLPLKMKETVIKAFIDSKNKYLGK